MDDREEQASRYCEEVLQLICIAIPAFRFDLEIQIAASKSLALLLADGKDISFDMTLSVSNGYQDVLAVEAALSR